MKKRQKKKADKKYLRFLASKSFACLGLEMMRRQIAVYYDSGPILSKSPAGREGE